MPGFAKVAGMKIHIIVPDTVLVASLVMVAVAALGVILAFG